VFTSGIARSEQFNSILKKEKKNLHVSNSRGDAASQVPEGTMICPKKKNGHCEELSLSTFI